MPSKDYPPVSSTAHNIPVRIQGTTTTLPNVTFQTYSPSFLSTFGMPIMSYAQFIATLHHNPLLPPDLQLPNFTAEFPRFSRHMTFLRFCRTLDDCCMKQGKVRLCRKDKESIWFQEVVRKFQTCTLWDRAALVRWDVGGGKKLKDLDEVNEWMRMKFCEKIEEVRESRVLAY
jgi:hypothetical protein